MKLKDFKIGDVFICKCGFNTCPKLFKVSSIHQNSIEAVSIRHNTPMGFSLGDLEKLELDKTYNSKLGQALR